MWRTVKLWPFRPRPLPVERDCAPELVKGGHRPRRWGERICAPEGEPGRPKLFAIQVPLEERRVDMLLPVIVPIPASAPVPPPKLVSALPLLL